MSKAHQKASARLRPLGVVVVAVLGIGGASAWQAGATLSRGSAPGQLLPTLFPPETTATTAPPASEPSTTAVPPAGEPAPGGDPAGGATTGGDPAATPDGVASDGVAPDGGADGGADGLVDDVVRIVPPEAQAVINSIRRSAPNDAAALVAGAGALEALGVPHDEAVRAVFGRFPIAGYTRWTDDWMLPRWTGAMFRYHLGCDLFADYGTPVRSPADGVARVSNSELGGLAVRVVEPDGTFYYLAHLSALAEGLTDGQSVAVGDMIGYVGDSGNARGGAPHVHFAVHPRGGAAVPPKPIVDEYVAEAVAALPAVLASYQAVESRALAATNAVRLLADGASRSSEMAPAAPSRAELLFASSANPAGGGVHVADASAAAAAESVDWERHAIEQQAFDVAWEQSATRARALLGPLVAPALRDAMEARRSAAPG